jgi:choline dehydrogenase-like flavoprotein
LLVDAHEIDAESVVRSDICIIGGGAAGISIARELHASGRSVCLLEGGAFEPDAFSTSLYEGSFSGTLLQPEDAYLTSSRLRFFGGTTNHWAGWCRPLDPIDFEVRDWIPHSGWPLSRAELEPYYGRAAAVLQIRPFDYDPRSVMPELPPDDGGKFDTVVFHMSPPTRFGTEYRDELVAAPNVRVVLQATATRLEAEPQSGRVRRVECRAPDKRRFFVEADRFVLATGGIENARLLLLSTEVDPPGLPLRSDAIGRYFMDHPHVTAGFTVLSDAEWFRPYRYFEPAGFGHRAIALLKPSVEMQRELELPNIDVYFRGAGKKRSEKTEREALALALVDGFDSPSEPEGEGPTLARIRVKSEALPNPESRVTLAAEKDAFGSPLAHLDWRLGARDATAVRTVVEQLALDLGARARGRAQVAIREDAPWLDAHYGSHHLGTTRMHANPKQGVVDADCRVHGVENLYIAGSSVFPTGGVSNPTLTIVALALRLADRLRTEPA